MRSIKGEIKTWIAYFNIFGKEKIIIEQNEILKDLLIQNNKLLNEIRMSEVLNSTIKDSEWFKYQSISPGGSAVDYAFFYTLYRVLNSLKPKHILEFGLGQSSIMIHQFANYFKSNAITVEHDEEWAKFFTSSAKYDVHIEKLNLKVVEYKGSETITYDKCDQTFKGMSFDLILVDGPFGYNVKKYSRTQIINLVDNNLKSSFCILIDDYDRIGEQNTANEVFNVLNKKNIEYSSKVYEGSKKHLLICSKDLYFLTTLI